jgi:thiol-disulfide isomerase/thioredoxin
MNFVKIIIFISSILSGIVLSGAPLELGDKAPDLKIEKWIKGGPVNLSTGKGKNIYIVEFWATWCPPCRISIPHLTKLQNRYKDKSVIVVAISKEDPETVEEFVQSQKDMDYNVGVDTSGETYLSYMEGEAGIPCAFIINKEGIIVWRGHPLEMESTLKEVIDGTFDIALTKQITELQKKLQAAVRREDPETAVRTAQQLLILNPDNDMAMGIMLYVFKNKKMEALSFLDQLIQMHPGSSKPYMEKIKILSQVNNIDDVKKVAVQYIEQFQDNASKLNSLAWVLLELPFALQPLKEALNAAEKSVEVTPPSDKMLRAAHIDTLARCYYTIGRIDKAIEQEKKALALVEGSADAKMFKEKITFYTEAMNLGKTIK